MTRAVCSLLFAFLVFPCTTAFAQATSDVAARQAAQDRADQLTDQKRRFDALAELVNKSQQPQKIPPTAVEVLNAKFADFQAAIPKFREATNRYSWELSMNGKLDKPLKDIDTQTKVMLDYMKVAKFRYPPTDPTQFKGYSAPELQWETLNSAERIGSFVDFAVVAELRGTISPEVLEFLFKLDGELLRLKWLTSHTK